MRAIFSFSKTNFSQLQAISDTKSLVVVLAVVILNCTNTYADDATDSKRISAALIQVRDQIFQNCIIKLKVESNANRNGNVELKSNGNSMLATCSELSISDKTISMAINMVGRRKQESTYSEQHYLSRKKKCLIVKYDIKTTFDRSIRSVSYWQHEDFEKNRHGLMQNIQLDSILCKFGPFDGNIADIVNDQLPVLKRNSGGRLTGQYTFEYGLLEVTVQQIGKIDRLIEAKVIQTPNNVYNSLSKGAKLAEIRESALGKTPDGLLSASKSFRFTYDDASTKPFDSLRLSESITANGQSLQYDHTFSVVNYIKCFNAAEIEALRIPIPDGEKVYVVGDPNEGAINLTYRNGDIVRQVDGAPLEKVATEERFHKNLIRVFAFSFGILSIAIGTWYARKRLFTKSSVKQ